MKFKVAITSAIVTTLFLIIHLIAGLAGNFGGKSEEGWFLSLFPLSVFLSVLDVTRRGEYLVLFLLLNTII